MVRQNVIAFLLLWPRHMMMVAHITSMLWAYIALKRCDAVFAKVSSASLMMYRWFKGMLLSSVLFICFHLTSSPRLLRSLITACMMRQFRRQHLSKRGHHILSCRLRFHVGSLSLARFFSFCFSQRSSNL